MTTEVANKASGALAALGSLKAGLANVQQTTRINSTSGDPILRLGRDGKWVYGAENIEVDPESEWGFNPLSIRHGLVCWKVIPKGSKDKPKLFGKHVYPMSQNPPAPETLQAYDDEEPVDHKMHPWAYFSGGDVRCVASDDPDEVGEQCPYETSSEGGKRAMADLIDKIMKRIDKDPDHPVPVIRLKSDSYIHAQYGKTYFPVLEIVRWVGMDGGTTAAPAAEVEQPEPKVVAKTPEPEQAANDEEETVVQQPAAASEGGTRRRRRVA